MSNNPKTRRFADTRRLASSEPCSTSRLVGNWQLDEVVASGRMRNVYFARPLGCPPSWPADYAVKVLNADFAEDPVAINSLQREAEVGRHSSHSNLVPILEAGLSDVHPHVVMPRLHGACLSDVIQRVGRLAIPQAIWIARQVGQALQHLHENGWIHADVKPANMIVSEQGHATLVDLGSSLRPDESIFSWQRPLAGTLEYVAPETLTSAMQTSPASDIYSLGISLFEMLTGRLPFTASNPSEWVESQLRKTPPRVSDVLGQVPNEIVDLVRRMLSKSPLRRPQSAAELVDELSRLEIGLLTTHQDKSRSAVA